MRGKVAQTGADGLCFREEEREEEGERDRAQPPGRDARTLSSVIKIVDLLGGWMRFPRSKNEQVQPQR